ncbi:MAG: hypothetical protein DRP59_00935 [Spirochaetes bacterium]|nr:MAG: hypothetical protein DRP59_00935 [Spirochaetota bacterium]
MIPQNPLLVDTGRGFSVFYQGRYLYNKKTPVDSAERKVRHLTILPKTVLFLPSPLLFYGIETLLQSLPEDCLVLAFETEGQLCKLYEKTGITIPDDNRFHYLINDIPGALQKLRKAGIHNFRRVSIITLTGGYLLNKDGYRRILKVLEAAVKEFWQNRMTEIHLSPLWIRNIFLNLASLAEHQNRIIKWDFAGIENSRPVLVAGAGESLEESIPRIKRHQNGLVIVAVDTAVSALIHSGITPDYIVAVDAQVYNLFDFIGIKKSSIPLFFDLTCYPSIVRNFKGPLYPFLSVFSDNTLISRIRNRFENLTILPPLGSVGITAVYIALMMSDGPVIHTGLDFSYLLGKSHARGTPFHSSILFDTTRLLPVENIGGFFNRPFIKVEDKTGKERVTNTILYSYAKLMNEYFGKEKRLYDLGTVGLRSAGKIMSEIDEAVIGDSSIPAAEKESERIRALSETGRLKNISFLEEELKKIKDLHSELYHFLTGETSTSNVVKELLTSMDYLFKHFPDFPPKDEAAPDYIKRVLLSAEYFSGILSKSLSITLEDRKKS